MKKLIYNENTKEIEIVEKEAFSAKEKKKQKRVKSWLENNKIYFEVFSYLFIGVMGIVIAFERTMWHNMLDLKSRDL